VKRIDERRIRLIGLSAQYPDGITAEMIRAVFGDESKTGYAPDFVTRCRADRKLKVEVVGRMEKPKGSIGSQKRLYRISLRKES
jgi:hypothetical protein